MADHRADVYFSEERGKWIFRASSLSRCIQSLVAAGLGHERMPPPEMMRKAWAEGTHGEAKVLQLFCDGREYWHPKSPIRGGVDGDASLALRFKSLPPTDPASYHYDGASFPYVKHELLQTDQIDADTDPQFVMELPVGDQALIRGHLDQIVECFQGPIGTGSDWIGRRFVNEAKLFGVDYFRQWLKGGMDDVKFTGYAWQLSLYMIGTGLPGFFTVGEKQRWKEGDARWDDTPEEQRYDLERVHVTLFDAPPVSLAVMKMKVLKTLALIERGELPQCDQKQYPCDYYHLCGDQKEITNAVTVKPGVEVVKVEGEAAVSLALAAENYTLVLKRSKAVEAEVKAAKAKLDELLNQAGKQQDVGGAWDVGGMVVEWQVTERKAEEKPRAGYTVRSIKIKQKEDEG